MNRVTFINFVRAATVLFAVALVANTAKAENGLTGEYFNSMDLTKLVATRVDPVIDLHWKRDRPFKELTIFDNSWGGGYQFSARWTGFISVPKTGEYTFWLLGDDGARMWVDGRSAYDRWSDRWGHGSNEDALKPIAFTAGQQYPIKIEYYNSHVIAEIRLAWVGPGIEKQTVPTEYLSTDGKGGHGIELTAEQQAAKNAAEAFLNQVTSKRQGADPIADWDKRLVKRTQAVVIARHYPKFQVKALKSTVTLQAVSNEGSLTVAVTEGGQIELKWVQLEREDLLNLALALGTEETPLDHALAAFYLLLDGQTTRASEHLSKAQGVKFQGE